MTGIAAALARIPADLAAAVSSLAGVWPPGPWAVVNAGQAAGAVLLAAVLLAVCDGTGLSVLRLALGRRPAGAMRLLAPFAGYAALSYALLGVAAAGLFDRISLGLLAGAFAAAAWGSRPRGLPGAAAWLGSLWREAGWAGRLGLLAAGSCSAILLAPPETYMDCMQYHLAFPEQLLTTHKLFGRGMYLAWALPLAADLPNIFPVALGLDAAAKVLRPVLAGLGGLAVLRAFAFSLPTPCEAGAAWLALVFPAGGLFLMTAKNDGVVVGFALAGAAALAAGGLLARRGPRARGALFVAGCLLGVLVMSKWVIAPVAILVAVAAWGSTPPARRAAAAGILAAGGVLTTLPWALRSWFYLADPAYPLGCVWVPGIFGPPADAEGIRGTYRLFIRETRPRGLFIMETLGLLLANAWLVLPAIPFWRRRRPSGLGGIAVALLLGIGATVLVWRGGLFTVERFLYPAFALLDLLAVAVLFEALRGRMRVAAGWLVFGVLGLVVQARILAGQGPEFPGAPAAEFVSGRRGAAAFRQQGLLGFGEVLPVIRRTVRMGGVVLTIGEPIYWGIPARVVGEGFEPPFVRATAQASATPGRIAVRFRQAGIRWISYNPVVAGQARFLPTPWDWTPRMLAVYATFVRDHVSMVAASGRVDPLYGSSRLLEVRWTAGRTAGRLPYLPGAERAFAAAALAELHGKTGDSVRRFEALRAQLPGVAAVDAWLGHALLVAGRPSAAYVHLRASVDAGVVDEVNLLDLAAAAGRIGRRPEASSLLRRARDVYPLWPDRVRLAAAAAGVASP